MNASSPAKNLPDSPEGRQTPYTLDIQLRDYRDTDRNLILSTYLRAFADSYFCKQQETFVEGKWDRSAYYRGQEALCRDRLIPSSRIVVAALPEEEDAVVGWLMGGEKLVHFVYVKQHFRRMGVARKLLQGFGEDTVYSHRTLLCEKLPLPKGWRYDLYPMINAGM